MNNCIICNVYVTTYGAECCTMKRKDERLMNKTEMRMLRWIQDVSLRDQNKKRRDQESGNSLANNDTPDA